MIDPAVAATCTTPGKTEGKHCSVCNEVLVAQTVTDALGHDFTVAPETTDEEHYLAPTCTDSGLVYNKCSRCDTWDTVGTEIAALGHTEVIDAAVAATCTETGLTEGKHCSVCSEVLVAQTVTDALGHEYKYNVVAPTCTAEGYTQVTCERCDYSDMTDIKEALGHSNYQYTDNGDGTHKVTCGVCSGVITASEAHAYVDGTCPCGATEQTGPVEDASLKFFSKALNMQSYLGFQFIVAPKVYSAYDKVWVEVYQTKYNKTAGTDDEPVLVSYTEMEQSGYHGYEIKLDSVAMTDNLDVTLYAEKDGVTYIGEHITGLTVRSQVVTMANNTLSGTLTTKKINQLHMLADLLVYGAAAQMQFGFRTSDLATDGVSDTFMAYATTTMPDLTATVTTEGTAGTVTVMSKALNLASVIEQQIIYKFPSGTVISNYEAHILVEGSEEPIVIDGSEFLKATSTIYGVSFSGLGTNKMGTIVRFSIWDKTTNTQVSVTTVSSINAMATDMYNRASSSESQKAIALAVMNYGASSKAYFG